MNSIASDPNNRNLRCSAQPGSRANSPAAQTSTSPVPSGLPLLGAFTRVLGLGADSGSVAGDAGTIILIAARAVSVWVRTLKGLKNWSAKLPTNPGGRPHRNVEPENRKVDF